MKIKFTKFPTTVGTIKISLDGGQSFTEHNIADIYESGIPLDDNQDYEKIMIKGSSNVLKNLDVISKINTHSDDDLLPEDITGIVLKDFNGKFDKSLLQKYPNLKNLTIPEGVTYIYRCAFKNCSSLTSIILPDSVTSIGSYAFEGCSSLTNVTISKSVTAISGSAFLDCTGLKSITIPNSVITIFDEAFYNCTSLTSITIPESVTSIGNLAFYGCSNLRTINYEGTKEQWNAINKEPDWNDNCPSDMVIKCEPISEQVLPQYRAVKNYYITKRNQDNYKTDDVSEKVINGWYVPQMEYVNMRYKFIGTDSINGLGIFAVVAYDGYCINEEGKAEVIMDDGVSNEIDYETGFYIPVSEQTEDSPYVAIFNDLETTWYVAYENNHMEEDGKCEDGYRMEEYNGKKYAVPESLYNCESIAPFPVCELENGLLFVVRAAQGYVVKNGKAMYIHAMDADAVAPHKVNYITGYWKLP